MLVHSQHAFTRNKEKCTFVILLIKYIKRAMTVPKTTNVVTAQALYAQICSEAKFCENIFVGK